MATKMLREREREGEVLGVTEGQLELTRGLLLCISSFGGTTSSVRKQRLDWDQGKKLKESEPRLYTASTEGARRLIHNVT
jgi:hypothetical protein